MKYQGHSIEAIIFDLGGVILNIDYQKPVEAFKTLGIQDFSQHFAQHGQTSLLDDYETGRISSDDFLVEIQKLTGPKVSRRQIIEAWNSILLDLPEERLHLLEEAAASHRIFLLSNTNDLHIEQFNTYLIEEHQIPSLEPFFEGLYLSYELGLRKPEPEIFRHVLEDAGLNPSTTLFIDDSKQHIESAQKLGIHAHWLPPGTLADFLSPLL
jgi:FMN phosphatase YigB (HAD superfamily)